MVQIKNDVFCLDISETGAELTNLSIRGVNILWKRSSLWNNQSPISVSYTHLTLPTKA